ncbi:MAG: alpha/beta hydrolase [Burkholderiales bacterium]|nr:alpha/beta hydrolase [Burkholderiales bacterium]
MEWATVASILKIAAAVVIGVPLLAYFTQDSLIFYRQPLSESRRADLAKRAPAVREVFLLSDDGVRLQAWHAQAPGSSPLVLYFGGNAEESSGMLDELHNVPGVSWLIVSYRGYGLSEGAPGEAALVADALRWFDYAAALAEAPARGIYVFGRSLGSGVAVALAARRPVAGVILVAPYESLTAVAKRYYWYLPVDLLLRHRFDSLALAPGLRQPLLCLAAERDEVVPPVHAERLFHAWGGPKTNVLLKGASHNSTDAHPLFWQAIRGFLARRVD